MNKIARVLINSLEVLLLIVFVIFNNNVSADNQIKKDCYYYEIINGEVRITKIIAVVDPYTIKIPEEIEGYPVTTIASNAYYHHLENDSIIIPDSVVTIEKDAFLTDNIYTPVKVMTIPKSVQNIGQDALGYYVKPEYSSCGSTEVYLKYYKIEGFVIRGYKGTAAETYALQNRFTFIALDDEPVTTTTPVTTDITTTETTVVTTQTTAVSNTATSSSVSTTSIAETTPVTTTVTIPEIKGDANGDGKLAASDAAFIAKELAQSSISGEKITAEDYPSMDFNQDGKITAKDAADIARYLAEQSISDNKKVWFII